jgi:hypothetical protein
MTARNERAERLTFTRVAATPLRATAKAVHIRHAGAEHWVPRALLSTRCEAQIDAAVAAGDATPVEIVDWKADALGLEPMPEGPALPGFEP